MHLKFKEDNYKASAKHCRKLLAKLEQNLKLNLKEGRYAKSGGFEEYQEDVEMIENQYETTLGLRPRNQYHSSRQYSRNYTNLLSKF